MLQIVFGRYAFNSNVLNDFFRVSAKVDLMRLYGTPKDGVTPVMVRSVQKESGGYLFLLKLSCIHNRVSKLL